MSQFSLPLPSKITDDPGSKSTRIRRSSRGNDLDKDEEILDKLKALSPSSSESESTKSKPSKALRKRQRRLDFVLSYQQENDGESFWHALKQPISLSMDDTYVSFGPNKEAGKLASAKTSALILTDEQRKELDAKVAGDKKLEIKPKVGRKTLKKAKKAEREKTKGDGWFGMPATEMTEEVKRDLEVLQMRGALDPKRFYKKNDMSVLPKYFQIGQYVDSPADFYSDRSSKKAKKRSLVDDLMADAEFKKYNKRKFTEIIAKKARFMPKKDQRKLAKGKKKKPASTATE